MEQMAKKIIATETEGLPESSQGNSVSLDTPQRWIVSGGFITGFNPQVPIGPRPSWSDVESACAIGACEQDQCLELLLAYHEIDEDTFELTRTPAGNGGISLAYSYGQIHHEVYGKSCSSYSVEVSQALALEVVHRISGPRYWSLRLFQALQGLLPTLYLFRTAVKDGIPDVQFELVCTDGQTPITYWDLSTDKA